MAQVVAHDQCILQDGHVVEAVCVKCTNCGGKFDVSPRQLLKAALGGFPPRELCYECTKQARAAAEAAYAKRWGALVSWPPINEALIPDDMTDETAIRVNFEGLTEAANKMASDYLRSVVLECTDGDEVP